MGQYVTKYFGSVSIDETSGFESLDVEYQNQAIQISLFNIPCSNGDRLKTCLSIIDRYVEINEIAKKAMQENCLVSDTIKFYFEHHFNELNEEEIQEVFGVKTFDDFDATKTIGDLEYPDMLLSVKDDQLHLSVDYRVSKKYSDEILCVKMDEELNVVDFSHES